MGYLDVLLFERFLGHKLVFQHPKDHAVPSNVQMTDQLQKVCPQFFPSYSVFIWCGTWIQPRSKFSFYKESTASLRFNCCTLRWVWHSLTHSFINVLALMVASFWVVALCSVLCKTFCRSTFPWYETSRFFLLIAHYCYSGRQKSPCRVFTIVGGW